MADAPMTPTTLAETILRDVPRHTIRLYVDDLTFLLETDVLAALTAAMDPAIAERDALETERRRAVNEAETLRHYRKSHVDAEERLTAAEAQIAAMEAQIKGLEGGIEAACDREAETERKLRTALAASETRAEAAEAQIAALTARVERLTGAGNNLVARLYQMWTEARDHRDRGDLGSAEYAKRDMAASAFRDAYLASRAILSATTEESK